MRELDRSDARAVIETVLPSVWDGPQEDFPVGTTGYEKSTDRIAEMESAILVDLRRVGVSVRTVHDLTCDSPEVAEVLIDHLMRPYPMLAKEHLLGALASPAARPFFEFFRLLLVEAVRSEGADADVDSDAGDGDVVRLDRNLDVIRGRLFVVGAANVLVHAFRSVDDLVPLIDDPELGVSRVLLMSPLEPGRYKAEYERWASDPDLAVEVSSVLRGRRSH